MSQIVSKLKEVAEKDLKVHVRITRKKGPHINVGEQFLASFYASSKANEFIWNNVTMFIYAAKGVTEIIPDGEGASPYDDYTTYADGQAIVFNLNQQIGSPWVCRRGELVRIGHLIDVKTVCFKALAVNIGRPRSRSFCKVGLFSSDYKINLYSFTKTSLRTPILPKVLSCANGHEYSPQTGYVYCPLDGLPLE